MKLISNSFTLWQADYDCWKCDRSTKVFAIGSDDTEELLMNVTAISDAVKNELVAVSKVFFFDKSNMTEESYLMNHCEHCGAKLGDWFLHSEPDGPFWGDSEESLLSRHAVPLEVESLF
jgi:hypothetical protein